MCLFPWALEWKTRVFYSCAVIIHFRKVYWVYFEHGRHCGWLGKICPSWGLHVISGKAVVVRLLPFLSHCQSTRLDSQIAFPLGPSAGRWDQAVMLLSAGKWKCIGKLDPFLLLEQQLGWEHLHPEPLFLLGKSAASQEADRQWTMGMAYKPVHKECSAFQARTV